MDKITSLKFNFKRDSYIYLAVSMQILKEFNNIILYSRTLICNFLPELHTSMYAYIVQHTKEPTTNYKRRQFVDLLRSYGAKKLHLVAACCNTSVCLVGI